MRTWNPAFDGPPSEEAVRLSREWPFESVLDVGCGSGRNLLPYAGRGALLVGFDLDESAVRAARTRVGAPAGSPRWSRSTRRYRYPPTWPT